MKPTLAFIDHSFHRKTGASAFLLDILRKEYKVEIYWDDSWQKGARVDLKKISQSDCNTVVFFQVFRYPPEEIKLLGNKRVILFPMFDACPVSTDFYWGNFASILDLGFINFSKTLHERMVGFGFDSLYSRYFLPVDETPREKIDSGSLKGFFWQRTDKITWNHIRILIKEANFDRFTIHSAIDPPGYDFVRPGDDEIKKYNIDITKWFAGREDYLRVVSEADVFFAPRVQEGIGMAFLEAMASGKCVVAPDSPTMNEYITHGETGLLYHPKRPGPLDFSNIEKICANTKEFVAQGHDEWRRAQDDILEFIKAGGVAAAHEGGRVGENKLTMGTVFYFRYRQVLHNLKTIIKKCLPGVAKLRRFIKRKF